MYTHRHVKDGSGVVVKVVLGIREYIYILLESDLILYNYTSLNIPFVLSDQ